MKTLMLITITILSFAAFVPTLSAQDINLANLSASDVKAIRKIIADRDYEKSRADEAEKQRDYWQTESKSWNDLYVSEKQRADTIQEGRITECKDQSADLTKANALLHDQHADDVKEIGQLNAEIDRLKSHRKWYFGTGVAVGAVSGFYIGKNTSRIQTIFTTPAQTAAKSQFGFRLNF